MKKLKKAQNGTNLTPARMREVADSLDFESRKKVYSKINKTTKIDNSGDYNKYEKSVKDYNAKAEKEFKKDPNAIKAKKYRSLADSAAPKKKMGGMIKRADGSYSKRGLWDNIRANKGSGKKPTAAMLKQEKKIKAQTKNK